MSHCGPTDLHRSPDRRLGSPAVDHMYYLRESLGVCLWQGFSNLLDAITLLSESFFFPALTQSFLLTTPRVAPTASFKWTRGPKVVLIKIKAVFSKAKFFRYQIPSLRDSPDSVSMVELYFCTKRAVVLENTPCSEDCYTLDTQVLFFMRTAALSLTNCLTQALKSA